VEAGRSGIASFPNEWTEHYHLGAGYEGTGKYLEALSEYQKAAELSGGNLDAIAALGHAYAVSGRKAEAQKILREMQQNQKTPMFHRTWSQPYTPDLRERSSIPIPGESLPGEVFGYSLGSEADLRLDNLRSDPRFQDLCVASAIRSSFVTSAAAILRLGRQPPLALPKGFSTKFAVPVSLSAVARPNRDLRCDRTSKIDRLS